MQNLWEYCIFGKSTRYNGASMYPIALLGKIKSKRKRNPKGIPHEKKWTLPEGINIRLLNENSSVRDELSPGELLAGGDVRAYSSIKAIATDTGCMPELDIRPYC